MGDIVVGVTFLIGNGFDISIGLKTQYKDFYQYIINNYKYSDDSKNEILDEIKGNIEQWSNLEKKLGDYTECIGNDEDKLEKFYDDKFDLDIKLRDYLKTQEDRIDWVNNITIQNIRDNFGKYIYYFENLFTPVERDEIANEKGENNVNTIKIISFNYTNVIKKCIEVYENKFDLLYLHGSLERDNAILGVNDITQIKNEFFKEASDMLISMCKLEINKELGEYSISKAENLLENNIVCIYGMSMGDTDKYWWDKVVDNLIKEKIKMIIIFQYDSELNMRSLLKVKRKKELIQDQLLNFYSGEIENKLKFKNKIKVLFNSDMFKLDVVFKEDSDVQELIASTKTD